MTEPRVSAGSLPPIRFRPTHYERARTDLLRRLLMQTPPQGGTPPLARLQIDDEGDWIVALCDAWGALAEVISFYQERILNEAFLATASEEASKARIYHSLGHQFPPNATATTIVAYHLTSAAAGVEAVTRAQRAGAGIGVDERERLLGTGGAPLEESEAGTGPAAPGGVELAQAGVQLTPAQLPPAGVVAGAPPAQPADALGTRTQIPSLARVRAVPGPDGNPPTFVTLQPLSAQVTASKLKVAVQTAAPAAALEPTTTQIELAGVQTGLAVGQPILIVARAADGAEIPPGTDDYPWIRVLTSVRPDAKRGSTRAGWQEPLGKLAAGVTAPVVYGFGGSSPLAGSTAAAWSSLSPAAQLAVHGADGRPRRSPIRGGIGRSSGNCTDWKLTPDGLPAGTALTAVAAYSGGIVVVAADQTGLFRAVGDGPFEPAKGVVGQSRVYFLGGSARRMLAGASGGAVYESIDNGLTWSPVAGGPPTRTNGGISPNRLPSTPVRCVVDVSDTDDELLLAGTGAGLFVYNGSVWLPVPTLKFAVFDLLVSSPARGKVTVRAATTAGVFTTEVADASDLVIDTSDLVLPKWISQPSTKGGAYALAELDEVVYAVTDDGVLALPDGTPAPGIPAGGAVTALTAYGDQLLAGTAEGIYRWSPGGKWQACDRALVFDLPADALPDPTVPLPDPMKALPGGLVAGFADHGLALADEAKLTEDGSGGFQLSNGSDVYDLVLDGRWQVWLQRSLPGVMGFAVVPLAVKDHLPGDVIAAAGPLHTIASEWPGFAVAGSSLELSPPVQKLAEGTPALIEQRVGDTPEPEALDLTGVAQDNVVRFGRQTPVTRIGFSQTLEPGFPRRAATVWTAARPRALFTPPEPAVATLEGDRIPLEDQLSAPVERGRLAAITGSPIGLAVAPLGGAARVLGAKSTPFGPLQADVDGVVTDVMGTVWLATSAGVFTKGREDKGPLRLPNGWPANSDRTPASASAVALVDGTPLAASPDGVQELTTGDSGEPGIWKRSGLAGEDVVALAASGSRVVAGTVKGAVHLCSDVTADPATWTPLGSVDAEVTGAALGPEALYVATASGVSRLDPDGGWTELGAGFVGSHPSALLLDPQGTLWAGSNQGLQTLAPGAEEWRRDPGRAGAVGALCLDQVGNVVVAEADGIFRSDGAGWQQAGPAPRSAVRAIASAPDGAFWLGCQAILPLEVAAGQAPLEVGHELVFAEAWAGPDDIATLDQGAMSQTLLDAFAENDRSLDTATLVISGESKDGYWLARDGGDLYVVVLRTDGTSSTVSAFRNRAVAYPIGRAPSPRDEEAWHVEVGGVPATLRAAAELIRALPAGPDAPALAETAAVERVEPVANGTSIAGAGSILQLEEPLHQIYDASTVQVNLNVVAAAQGQPVVVPIGSGDPRVAHQSFSVRTPIAAIGATPGDAMPSPESTLRIFVDRQPWTPVGTLADAGPNDQVYLVRANPNGTAVVHFGDGVHGSLLPSGRDNVIASYVQGGGDAGEAMAGALIQPLDRPQLVSAVHNPSSALVPATPARRASRMAAVRTLDRVVTLSDYEDMVLAQPGVASAAAELVDGAAGRTLVISVARTRKAPSDLVDQVASVLGSTAASGIPVRVAAARMVRVAATVEVVSDDPTTGERVGAALDRLAARRPGEPLLAAQVLSTATAVPGVASARIVSWNRHGMTPGPGTALSAAGAEWPAGNPAPAAAELLLLDGRSLETPVKPPAAVSPT